MRVDCRRSPVLSIMRLATRRCCRSKADANMNLSWAPSADAQNRRQYAQYPTASRAGGSLFPNFASHCSASAEPFIRGATMAATNEPRRCSDANSASNRRLSTKMNSPRTSGASKADSRRHAMSTSSLPSGCSRSVAMICHKLRSASFPRPQLRYCCSARRPVLAVTRTTEETHRHA